MIAPAAVFSAIDRIAVLPSVKTGAVFVGVSGSGTTGSGTTGSGSTGSGSTGSGFYRFRFYRGSGSTGGGVVVTALKTSNGNASDFVNT